MKSRVLIVGGAGYIGSALVPQILDEMDVTVLDTFWFGDFLPKKGVKRIIKNVMDTSEEDYRGYDQVIFFAGLSNDPMSEFMPKECYIQNAAAPAYVAMLCKKVGVKKFIYASTCSVYGDSPGQTKSVRDMIHVSYPYGISKYMGEQGVMVQGDEFFKTVAVRMGTVCGFSPRMRFDLLINTMYKNLMLTGEIKISNPALSRPVLFIQDACSVYRSLLLEDSIQNKVINAVSFNITLGELARQVDAWAKKRLKVAPTYQVSFIGDLRNYSAEPSMFLPCKDATQILDDVHTQAAGMRMTDPIFSNGETFKILVKEGLIV
jgi:nucleoside-diphosphate-sugar epimerase